MVWFDNKCFGSADCSNLNAVSGGATYNLAPCSPTPVPTTGSGNGDGPPDFCYSSIPDVVCNNNGVGRDVASDGDMASCAAFQLAQGNRYMVWYDDECYGSVSCESMTALPGATSYDLHEDTRTIHSQDVVCEDNLMGRYPDGDGDLDACITYQLVQGHNFATWWNGKCYGSLSCDTLTPLTGAVNYDILKKCTSSPTVTPTDSPTESPTESPTKRPSISPTAWPSQFPTESPTQSPTKVVK
jgi:hypothetical protein